MCIRDRINTMEEYKVEYKRSYLVNDNIQFAVQTHIKTVKKAIRVTQLKHNICDENTHSKYRANINYNDNNYNYNYKNYRDYYRRRTRAGHTRNNKQCVRQERQRGENEREGTKREKSYSSWRNKFSPYEQVSYTVEWNVNTEGEKRKLLCVGDYTTRKQCPASSQTIQCIV